MAPSPARSATGRGRRYDHPAHGHCTDPPGGVVTGRNNVFRVIIAPGIDRAAAVWAQEIYESRRKLRALLIPWEFVRMALRTDGWERSLELMGHAVTIAAAVGIYGASEVGVRVSHAESLRLCYPCFRGWTLARIEAALIERKPEAEQWVRRHMADILDFRRRYEAA